MGVIINGKELESMTHDGIEVQTWTHNGVEVYSAGKMVTYMVDSGISYQEKVKKGHSCLSPTTFTPSKSGWAFVGWREDSTASGSVLNSKVMERSPITLYAVFKQTLTLSYNGNGATSGSTASQSGTRYYNSGNYSNPSFTIRNNGFSRNSASFKNWALNSTSGTRYNAGASITLSSNATLYAKWTVTTTTTETANYSIPGGKYNTESSKCILYPTSMSGGGNILKYQSSAPYLSKTVNSLSISLSARMRIPGWENGDWGKFNVVLCSNGKVIKTVGTFETSSHYKDMNFSCSATNVSAGSFYIKLVYVEGYNGPRFEDTKTMSVTAKVTSTYEA